MAYATQQKSQSVPAPAPKTAAVSSKPLNSEGHPIYYAKGSKEANNIISWNKKQNYSKSYIQKMQRTVGTDDDGSIGTNTINAIRHYQEKNGLGKDGKWGNECATFSGLTREYASGKSKSSDSTKNTTAGNTGSKSTSKKNVDYMTVSSIDLSELQADAEAQGYDVKKVGSAAKFVAYNCMSSKSQHQCTRGTSLFLQLASYARGLADKWYKSSCAADKFGNGSSNGNIASEVSAEYSEKSGSDTTGKSKMSNRIASNLSSNGDYVTFSYKKDGVKSQHIVFKVGSSYYSDFAQGTAAGCGNESSTYWNIKYYTHS